MPSAPPMAGAPGGAAMLTRAGTLKAKAAAPRRELAKKRDMRALDRDEAAPEVGTVNPFPIAEVPAKPMKPLPPAPKPWSETDDEEADDVPVR